MGKTVADQDRIDDTVAGGCATKVYKPAECDRQTKAGRTEIASRDRATD